MAQPSAAQQNTRKDAANGRQRGVKIAKPGSRRDAGRDNRGDKRRPVNDHSGAQHISRRKLDADFVTLRNIQAGADQRINLPGALAGPQQTRATAPAFSAAQALHRGIHLDQRVRCGRVLTDSDDPTAGMVHYRSLP
jgi:hypothetical protein